MKKFRKSLSFMLLLIVLGINFLAGCRSTTIPEEENTAGREGEQAARVEPSELEHVELTMYLIGNSARDYDEVLAKFNEKLKEDINATLEVSWIGWGDFQTKYPLILGSGEPIDLIYTSTWLDFYQLARKGAFMALNELAPNYAPKSFADTSEEGLIQATIDGQLFALPPNYVEYATYGTIIRGDLRESYGIDSIETLDDLGAFFGAVTQNNPELDPAGMYSTQTPIDALYFYQQNLYPLSGDIATNCPFWIDFTDPEGKVVNIINKETLPEILAKFYEWSNAGYWPKSVLSNKDFGMLRNGRAATLMHNLGSWVGLYLSRPEYKLEYTTFLKNSYPLPMMQNGIAIPASARNPERALMMLELLRNDREYYNLLTYGIEGKHYEITQDGLLRPLDQEGFLPEGHCSWGWRDTNFRYDIEGSPSILPEIREKIRAGAKPNIYTMFNINIDPIRSEYSAVLNVMQQYYVPLKLGYVEPIEGLETLKQRLESAGVDTVHQEIQRQIDEFREQVQNR